MFCSILIINYLIYFTLALKQHNNFLTNDYAASSNSRHSARVAGRSSYNNSMVLKRLVSNVSPGEIQFPGDTHYIDDNTTVVPESFDARDVWPKCRTIGQVWDQGVCSAGWAVSAASVLSDRVCIQKNQNENPVLSPEDLLSCCTRCRFDCDGGWPNFPWEYFNISGITTGGAYGSEIGCKSYTISPCSHFNGTSQYPPCSSMDPASIAQCHKTCDSSDIIYEDNLYYAEEYYRVYPEERQIKLEIMANGPVQATFAVWSDFLNYKSGVYVETVDSEYLGAQSIKIIGWGLDDSKQAYWLAVNSWNEEWGDAGLFKWLINNTDSSMEAQIYAALPYFPDSTINDENI